MKLKFKLTFKRGQEVVAEVMGHEVDSEHLRISDATDKVIEIEQGIERLTGLRVHIEQVL